VKSSRNKCLKGVANEREDKRISTNGLFICYIFQSCFPDAYIYAEQKELLIENRENRVLYYYYNESCRSRGKTINFILGGS